MKFTALASLALFASVTLAADLNVGSVISQFYATSTPKIPAAASTSLASALHSVDATWTDSPKWTSARDAIYSAAPSSAISSISKSGYRFDELTTQAWYTKSVSKAVQTDIANELKALDSAASKVLGPLATQTSKGGAVKTGAAGVAGVVVGVVGGLVAVL